MTRLIDDINDGYKRATRTVVCPYCWQLRSVGNLHQTKPRVKCIPCHERHGPDGKKRNQTEAKK